VAADIACAAGDKDRHQGSSSSSCVGVTAIS
jgi:hypothetical protein